MIDFLIVGYIGFVFLTGAAIERVLYNIYGDDPD